MQEKLSETEEEARRKMEELKVEGKEYKDEAGGRSREARDIEAEKGKAAKGNILSSFGGVTGAIKSKLTQPTDVVEREEVDVAETRPGEVAGKLYSSDQMHGQNFNDVGRVDGGKARVEVHIDDDGKVRVESPGKM